MDPTALAAEPDRAVGCDFTPQDYMNAPVTSPRYENEPQNDSLTCDSANQSLDPGETCEGTDPDESAHNIVATWADEFYRMAQQPPAESADDPSDPAVNFGVFVPSTVTSYPGEPVKQYECHLCKTTYATLARLKRHYGTKKHKALMEKSTANPPTPEVPPSLQPPTPHKLPDVPALQSPARLPQRLPQMPQFQTYGEFSPNVDAYPADWTMFHSQLEFLRSQQQMTPDPHPHQGVFFQPHINYPFGSLCNSHQSTLSHQSPQYLPETVSSPDPRYPPTYYQPQTPTPSWYYPITPYPSPNPYLQRHAEYPPSGEYQKYETNNNSFPAEPFDQRPFQQEALNLWQPKPNPPVCSVEEAAASSDGSETMSPAVSPDSQNEPVSSTECPDAPVSPRKCEQCHREVSKAHPDAAHPRCEACGQNYPSVLSMLVKNAVKCDVCDKEFGSKVELTRHKHLHKGSKEFSCHLCPKSCNRKDQLLRHLRVHESHGENQPKQFPG